MLTTINPGSQGTSYQLLLLSNACKPDEVADPVVESLHSKIMADLTVNNLAIDIKPSDTTMESVDADQPAGVLSADFIVIYRTEIDDLTQ